MKKQLNERFQELAGIKPLYSLEPGSLSEQETSGQICWACSGSANNYTGTGTWVSINSLDLDFGSAGTINLQVPYDTTNSCGTGMMGSMPYGYPSNYYTSPDAWISVSGSQYDCSNLPNTGMEITSSIETTSSIATTGCDGFANIPQDFQDLICTSCEDPNYVNVHCECCPGGSGMASITTGSVGTNTDIAGQSQNNTGLTSLDFMNQLSTKSKGAPQPSNYRGGGSDPKYLRDKASFINNMKRMNPNTNSLREIKNLIKKIIIKNKKK